MKSGIRNALLFAAVAFFASALAIAMGIYCLTLVVGGLALGLGRVLGDRIWAGEVIVGAAGLALLGFAIRLGWRRMDDRFKQQAIEKYGNRRKAQRAKFGRDVAEAAAARE